MLGIFGIIIENLEKYLPPKQPPKHVPIANRPVKVFIINSKPANPDKPVQVEYGPGIEIRKDYS